MTTGSFGTTAQTSAHLPEAFLHDVPVRETDQASMEGQGRQQRDHESGYTTQSGRLCRPVGVQHPRFYRPTIGQTNTTKIQLRNGLCRPVLRVLLRVPPASHHERRDSAGETCF